jgi:hypothetical protein
MIVEAKLMHMDILVGDNPDRDGHAKADHTLDLMFVGHGKNYFGGSAREIGMTLNVQVPRFLVKDYQLGEGFDISLSRENRVFQFDPELSEEMRKADPYELGAERTVNAAMTNDRKAARQAFKEAVFMTLRIRMQDPEFREQMRRDLAIADARK